MCTIQVHMPCQDRHSRHISHLLHVIMCHKAFGVGVITADFCLSSLDGNVMINWRP